MNDIDIDNLNEDIRTNTSNFFQIDLLKTFMIAFVIIDHAFAYTGRAGMGFELWERMSIPFFLIIMGFNMSNSFARQDDTSLKKLYSWNYFKKKLWRYIFPYLIFYIISTTAAFIIYEDQFSTIFSDNWFLDYILFQKAIFEGPGNWFIPVLFQSILIIPLLYKLYIKSPKLILSLTFIIEMLMHVFEFYYPEHRMITLHIVLLYLFGIALGMWFSQNKELFNKRNLFIWVLFPISLIYMIAWDFFNYRIRIDGNVLIRGDYNFLTFIYSALIFLLVIRIFPRNPKNRIAKGFTSIGRSTFHIYLLQDLFFSILYVEDNSLWTAPGFSGVVNVLGSTASDFLTVTGLMILNWLIIISFGVLWWYLEKKFRLFIQNRRN